MDAYIGVALALAKLYFKDNRKERALAWCDAVLQQLRAAPSSAARCCSAEDEADAYHLAGWLRIHADDHTGAYQLWSAGHAARPDCAALARHHRKRACWDDACEEEVTAPGLLGGGAHGDGAFGAGDLEAFAVPDDNRARTPALALFREGTQRGRLVFRTRRPVLTAAECRRGLGEVDAFHDECRGGRWGTVRHSSVKTTDVAVEGACFVCCVR